MILLAKVQGKAWHGQYLYHAAETCRITSEEGIWHISDQVKELEIPVVSIVELGILRQVSRQNEGVSITLAPRFAGCQALNTIRDNILDVLAANHETDVEISLTYSPPWSSDDDSLAARMELKAVGLAPQPQHQGLIQLARPEPV